jgi:hypothetical protein
MLYDRSGKPVRQLIKATYEPGEHTVQTDLAGIPGGLYIVKMNIGSFEQSRKLVVTN